MDETMKLINMAHAGDKAARDQLVMDNVGLIWSIVRRFSGRGYEMEDKKMETNREHMRLEMESLSRNEEFARVVTAVFMSRLDPTLEEVDDVKTAVSEAVTNAVIHGYRGGQGTIYLELTADLEERILTVAVKDRGVGIADVKQAMEPMFTTDPEGERSGMGFSFMEAFMDQVEVESQPNHGTLVTMKKFIGR